MAENIFTYSGLDEIIRKHILGERDEDYDSSEIFDRYNLNDLQKQLVYRFISDTIIEYGICRWSDVDEYIIETFSPECNTYDKRHEYYKWSDINAVRTDHKGMHKLIMGPELFYGG